MLSVAVRQYWIEIKMVVNLKSSVRLYVILARKAPLAVVFRRGPSKQVLLVLWHTDTDQFVEGQWLKGRIYERRCDLSPSGKRLIYFAARYRGPYETWTAISKPPFLTALALWPKGDSWGGGGLFNREKEILLNHRNNETALADGFKLPRWVVVKPLGEYSGRGEDNPIIDQRLMRDGWNMTQQGEIVTHGSKARLSWEFNPPEIWSKVNPLRGRNYELQELTHGLHERDGPWYMIEHLVTDRNSNKTISLGRTDWADWSADGDLLFAKEGKIFRLGFGKDGSLFPAEDARLLIDLTERKFERREAPTDVKSW